MRPRRNPLRALCCITLAVSVGNALASDRKPSTSAGAPLYQLRAYQLFEASKARFHERFRTGAMRIMRRHGFDIVATWEARRDGSPEFVYLLRWTSEAQQDRAWRAFLADPEWIAVKATTASPDAPIMGSIEDRTMELTPYSPPFPARASASQTTTR